MPRGGNTNCYGASPFPRSTLGYAASTANDISLAAFAHLRAMVDRQPEGALLKARAYAEMLEAIRWRLRAAFGLGADTDIVFAPSGTDLEIAALAIAAATRGGRSTNILLGADEVGSGCPLAASGRYFANETALGLRVSAGTPVAGLSDTELVNHPVRSEDGTAFDSAAVASAIDEEARCARRQGRHVIAHAVHGSKTGLVLPRLAEIDGLRALHGDELTLLVDACQARIEPQGIRACLERGAIVLLTGSKFIGGPPFSGFALVPAALRPRSPLAAGLASLFRRAEWPLDWAAAAHLPHSVNPGLLLRLEAALFELERYQTLDPARRGHAIAAFGTAVRSLSARLGAPLVEPALASEAVNEATLATLDLSALPSGPDLATAQRWCRVLAARGMRLGQPVRWKRLPGGSWAGNLRISLSMPMIATLADLGDAAISQRLAGDMAQIAGVLEAAQRPVVA